MELPGRCGDWLDTATVTVQGSRSGSTRRARGGDFYLATSGDFLLATCGDFLMARDKPLRSFTAEQATEVLTGPVLRPASDDVPSSR